MIGNLQGQPAGGGANTALSNLASVAINTSLISDTDSTDDLGSSTIYWANAYIDKVQVGTNLYLDGTTAAGKMTFRLGQAATGLTLWDDGAEMRITANRSYIGFYTGWGEIFQLDTNSTPKKAVFFRDAVPYIDSNSSLGSSTKYWQWCYFDRVYLNATAILDGDTAGHLKFVGDLVPTTDDTEWVGQLETPFKAIKGLIIKDTTDGKHYKITVVSGAVTATALD